MKDWIPRVQNWLTRLRKVSRPWVHGGAPMEIRRAVLEDIQSQAVSIGGGRKLFPYNQIEIVLAVSDENERMVLDKVIEAGWHLESAVEDRLKSLGCDPTGALVIKRRFVLEDDPERQDERFGERRFFIEYGQVEEESSPPSLPPKLSIQLRVLKGEAEKEHYESSAARIHLGRLSEVYDLEGHLERRNDVAFEDEGEVNASVSREHATIVLDRTRNCYVIRDNDSAAGTRIFRNGRPIAVSSHRGGVRLRDEDELSLGSALLSVRILEGQ